MTTPLLPAQFRDDVPAWTQTLQAFYSETVSPNRRSLVVNAWRGQAFMRKAAGRSPTGPSPFRRF